MKIKLLFVFLLLNTISNGQLQFNWVDIPETNPNILVTQDASNNSYRVDGTGNVIKLNASGTAVLTFNVGAVPHHIHVDASENIYVIGAFSGTVDLDPGVGVAQFTSGAAPSIYIAKYNSSGNYVFARQWRIDNGGFPGATVSSEGKDITTDNSGNIYVTGQFQGVMSFRNSSNTTLNSFNTYLAGSMYGYTIFLTKMDANGNLFFENHMFTPNQTTNSGDFGIKLKPFSNGDIGVICKADGSSTDFDPSGSTSVLTSSFTGMARYSAGGSFVSLTPIVGVGTFISSFNVGFDASNNTYFTGTSSADYFIQKYDASFNLAAQITFGSSFTENYNAIKIQIDNNGNSNVYGKLIGFTDFDPSTNTAGLMNTAGSVDIFLARYNTNLEYIYAVSMGDDETDPFQDFSISNNGIIYLIGSADSDVDIDMSNLVYNPTSIGTPENFLIKYQQSVLSAVATVDNHVLCFGGSTGQATVVATGSHPNFTYLWSPSGQTTATATGLSAGTHTVTVTDALGTTYTTSVVINQPTNPLSASITSQTDVNCNGGSNGSANVTVTGGTPNYSYSWSPSGGTAALATGLSANNYTVTVTDDNNCTTTASVTINQPTALTINISSQTNVACFGGSTGSATVTGSGGSGSYNYSWQPIGTTGATATGLSATTYTATVTDLNGCSASTPVIITQPTQLIATASSITNVTCVSTTDGAATVTASGGTPNYTYLWSPSGGTNASAANLAVGNYTCTVTDANFCSVNVPVTILNLIPEQEVCVVTVDTVLANHNIVVWEKATNIGNVDSFYIYREITTNVYSKIGAVHRDSLSEYHDYGANPNSTSYKYRITVLDTCGSEGNYGLYHKSIHLQYSGLGNFLWTFYEIESLPNQVASYNFWRDDLGTGVWNILQTVSGSTSSFTDVNYTSFPNARYRVDLNWISGNTCSPSRAGVNTSRSNIKNQTAAPVSINELLKASINVYPNPTGGIVNIVNLYGISIESISVMDASGKLCHFNSNQNIIDISNLERGIYFITINTSIGNTTFKVTRM